MKTIYIVRHGESESNVGGIITGGAATALTARGREQADFVATRCSRLPIDVIIASPYLRAKQTAEIIAARVAVPTAYSDLFVEINLGSHRMGRKADDPQLKQEERAIIGHFSEENWRLGDEENFSDLNTRAAAALDYLLARPEENILVIGHGIFSTILLGRIVMGADFSGRDCHRIVTTFSVQNTGITVLTHDAISDTRWNEWNVVTWNDHAHLR